MARKPEQHSILQFDSQGIAWVRVERQPRGGVVLADHAFLRGDWPDGAALEEALGAFARGRGVRDDVIFSILPRHELTTRILTLPTHDPQEIAGMLRFSAEEFVPYSADELVIDYAVLRELPSGEAVVFAALAHRDVVERHVAVLAAAGLEPEKLLLSTACVVSAAIAAMPAEKGRYAVVHLGAGGFEVAVIDGGVLVYSRGIATTQDWQALARDPGAGTGGGLIQESGADELAAEIRSSLGAFRRESEDGAGVDRVYIACDGEDVSALCRVLSESLGRECVPAGFAEKVVQALGAPGIPLAAAGGACAVAGGGALEVNLLPRRISEKRRLQGTQRLVLRAAVFAAVLLLLLGALYWQNLRVRRQLIDEFQSRALAMEPNARGISEKRAQLDILRRQVDRKGSIIEQFAAVVDAAPDDRVNITRISLDREEGVSIWGRAKTVDDVAEYAQQIRNKAESVLPFFAAARSLYEQKAMEQDQEIFTYQIEVPVEPEAAEKKTPEAARDVE